MIEYPRKVSPLKYFKEVLRYKDFLVIMSKKWVRSKYEHSYLGIGWIVISPLITALVYTVFFGMVFNTGLERGQYFLLIYSGLLPWLFFKDVFLEVIDIFPREPHIVKRTNFPRLIIPLSVVLLKFIEFVVGICFLFIISHIAGKDIGSHILLLPFIVLQVIFISVGGGLLLLFPCVIYRDIKHLLKFIVPLGIYSLPIIYRLKAVDPKWLDVYTLNPMVSVIYAFRSILFKEEISWSLMSKGMVISTLIFVIGTRLFIKYEKKLTDLI